MLREVARMGQFPPEGQQREIHLLPPLRSVMLEQEEAEKTLPTFQQAKTPQLRCRAGSGQQGIPAPCYHRPAPGSTLNPQLGRPRISRQGLRKDCNDTDVPVTVLLTYVSRHIKKWSFIEDKYRIKYLLTRDISNSACLPFFLFLVFSFSFF